MPKAVAPAHGATATLSPRSNTTPVANVASKHRMAALRHPDKTILAVRTVWLPSLYAAIRSIYTGNAAIPAARNGVS